MNIKWVLLVFGIFAIVGASLFLFMDLRYRNIYGDKYKVLNYTMMYWYPEYSVENVSYYLFEKGDSLYCKYESTNKDFYMCAWKFETFRDPLFGWVKIKDLEKR